MFTIKIKQLSFMLKTYFRIMLIAARQRWLYMVPVKRFIYYMS